MVRVYLSKAQVTLNVHGTRLFNHSHFGRKLGSVAILHFKPDAFAVHPLSAQFIIHLRLIYGEMSFPSSFFTFAEVAIKFALHPLACVASPFLRRWLASELSLLTDSSLCRMKHPRVPQQHWHRCRQGTRIERFS